MAAHAWGCGAPASKMESYRPTKKDKVALLSKLAERPKNRKQVYVLDDDTEMEVNLGDFLNRIAPNWVRGMRQNTKLSAEEMKVVERAPWFKEWLKERIAKRERESETYLTD
ncbi:unnamed protein product [Pedinophyceae sp. YPF-701]|nr:unnamed protein product [Pedinophyceae sp. YPF-701]